MALKPDDDFFAKVEYGFKLAIQRLYEQKAANNETAVISVNGEIKYVSAREIIEQQKQEALLAQKNSLPPVIKNQVYGA